MHSRAITGNSFDNRVTLRMENDINITSKVVAILDLQMVSTLVWNVG